ncbi:MAG: N-6 DNA methylase [Myxococcota bacterium]|nr:N-6 DNA methylase [Myxococcota bacterium]
MSDVEIRFHESWLGMVQPIEGLVVSVPVLVSAQCMQRLPPAVQHKLQQLAPETQVGKEPGPRRIRDLTRFLGELLELTPDLFDGPDALPEALKLYVPEGRQTLRPTLGLRRMDPKEASSAATLPLPDDSTAAGSAGEQYLMLVWDLPEGLPLDKSEAVTGTWDYPPSAKFDRLLRECRVPIGLLTNREVVRLVHAPHGESSGSITFRISDMATPGGRLVLDAFVMLLSAQRFFSVAPAQQLPQLLRHSRERQADVTNALAQQVFEALEILLKGFEGAAERDRSETLGEALAEGQDEVYGGLLTVLLRLVFLLYAEDRGLLPLEDPEYAEHLSVLGLFAQLQEEQALYPDSMSRRFGAWPRLLALFRAVFLGLSHGGVQMPARRGELFDPERYPFLEGWPRGGGAPIHVAEERSAVAVPTVDDETVYGVLERLLLLESQRLSYRALDVEQIGSVYEALMGYHVKRLDLPGVCLKPARVWVTASELLEVAPAQRGRWLEDNAAVTSKDAKAAGALLGKARSEEQVLEALAGLRASKTEVRSLGRLVLQPGEERRKTSSHYTPRSLSAPVVRKTLEPLLSAMGREPASERLLNLKVCDPAMGSGAFLVEACRYLADQVVAAWTREKQLERIASVHEDVVTQARRLVAQRCLYGVDKNPFAVQLAKLSMWLVTLAKDEPFTFVDHCLRHGDSLVGLDLEQLRSFHWEKTGQLELFAKEIRNALDDALESRQRILALAHSTEREVTREKERLLLDAEAALQRARLVGDLVVGAWFENDSDKTRKKARAERLEQVSGWLRSEEHLPPPDELLELQRELRKKLPPFHWMLEFPEVFHGERPDPIDADQVNHVAWMDAFVGNPPFAGKNEITNAGGTAYLPWLQELHEGAHGNADLCVHFFRRTWDLLGKHGTVGLIATKTVAQGDSRASGLQPIVASGGEIYDATRILKWPGEANVSVSIVHLAKGHVKEVLGPTRQLEGRQVPAVNSRLRGKPERPDPVPLAENANKGFVGTYVLGMGFTLTPERREELVRRNPRNAERIFPYIGGEEVNTHPEQRFDRYVINFGDMNLEEAEKWPDLMEIVRREVKPERDRNNREGYRKYWWQFGEKRQGLYESVRGLGRCLVNSQVSKHLVFAFQPVTQVFGHTLYVYADESFGRFGALQSRVHERWARLLASSMRADLRYGVSDCFEPFPFPTATAPLLAVSEHLYSERSRFMRERQVGLTQTYNQLKASGPGDADVVALRSLHLDLDRAVLEGYGWSDIEIPAFTEPATPSEESALELFEDEILDRLQTLNAERAAKQTLLGASKAKAAKKTSRAKSTQQLTLDHE